MTRTWLVAIASLVALAGCEDGPTQTYAPGPAPNAGAGSYVSPGSQPYAQGVIGGCSKDGCGEICTDDVVTARTPWILSQPILPPNHARGFDIGGGDEWFGLTIDDLERYDGKGGGDPGTEVTPGTPNGGTCRGATPAADMESWGNGALVARYATATRKITWISMSQGYTGKLVAITPEGEGKDTWEIPLAPNGIEKNGRSTSLDWTSTGRSFDGAFNQIYRALMHTFGPEHPLEPMGTTCFDTGHCRIGTFGNVGHFDVPVFGFTLWVDDVTPDALRASVPTRIDLALTKLMPYAFATPLLKLDAEGPIASAGVLQPSKPACTLKIGAIFSDFVADCVQTTGDAKKDKGELNELLGGLTHDTQRFALALNGAQLGFTHTTMKDDAIVHDFDVPAPGDVAQRFVVDDRTLGNVANDFVGNDPTAARDLHGAGTIAAEYVRLARADLLTMANVPDGDTRRCVFPVGWKSDPSFDRDAFWASVPRYCTGLEGFVTPRAPSGPGDRTNLGYDAAIAVAPNGWNVGTKPGVHAVTICDDANGDLSGGYASCIGGDDFTTMLARVRDVFGRGKLDGVPSAARDARFFFHEWARAFAKYLENAADPSVIDLSAVTLDANDVRFESTSDGGERAVVVDRSHADATTPPTVITVDADPEHGIVRSYAFDRMLMRGEETTYAATLVDATHGLGEEDGALLSNVFGSALLSSGWTTSSDGHSAFYCATHFDAPHCDGQLCPLDASGRDCAKDDLGRPILQPYPGAFSSTVLSLSISAPSPVIIASTNASLLSATIVVPRLTDPYDPTSPPLDPLTRLVPWTTKAPDVGFRIPVNGAIDRFVETSRLDLSGTTMRAVVDFDVHLDATTHKPDKDGRIDLKAVESPGFLGEIFVCRDAATGDVLRVRMGTAAQDIVDWLGSHPSAYDDCGMIVRETPFGDGVEAIASLVNGARVEFTTGAVRRVSGVTVFVPGE